MGFKSTSPGGFIGYTRVITPQVAGGVWNLNHQATESQDFLWPGSLLYKNSGDNLTGWENNGATTSNGTINVYGSSYCYINPMLNDVRATFSGYVFKTLTLDVNISNGFMGIMFGHSARGRGPVLKLDTRGGTNYTGLMFQNEWGVTGKAPVGGIYLLPNVWTRIRIDVNNSARCDWYTGRNADPINDVIYRDRQPVLINGRFIGILGFGGGGSVRNIRFSNGIDYV